MITFQGAEWYIELDDRNRRSTPDTSTPVYGRTPGVYLVMSSGCAARSLRYTQKQGQTAYKHCMQQYPTVCLVKVYLACFWGTGNPGTPNTRWHTFDNINYSGVYYWYVALRQRGAGIAGEKRRKNIPRSGGHTTGTHINSNETIYPPTYTSTAERRTTVTPTKRSTHPPCITAAQPMTLSLIHI